MMKETQVDSDIISEPDKNIKSTHGTLPSNKTGFLVSFLVDARGGALTGHRHWGMRVIIPPGAVQQPTRINCRYQPLSNIPFQPPFMEREALASRVIEITPAGEIFRSPVLLEIPHFASKADAEREMIVLRSEDGETWTEHISDTVTNEEIYQDVVTSVVMKDSEDLERIYDVLAVSSGRIIRILTSKFPKYFAVVTRIREESALIGPEGGRIKLDSEPRMRVTFPKKALNKKIKVGLQVQTVNKELVQAAFGRSVEVSRIVVVEPRRRKFHQPIFVSIPTCVPVTKTMSIRLLCSVTGSMEPAIWEDVTGSTPLELCDDVVHFSTKVSGIFWLLIIHDQQRDAASALTVANRLYYEASLAPYLTRFSVFYRENFPRAWVNTVRIYCMTDDKAEKVIQSLQGFRPLAISNDVEVPHTSEICVKLSGNILQLKQDPFTGEMLTVSSIRSQEIKEPFRFLAFEENSLTLLVQAKDNNQSLSGTLSFSRKLTEISATQQLGLCQLPFDVQSSVVLTNEHKQNGQDGFKGVVSISESREIKERSHKKISQTDQPIKEDINFAKEESETNSLPRKERTEEPTSIPAYTAQVEEENQYEKVGKEENPYEKIEIRKSEAFNGTVTIDKKKKKESVAKDVIRKEDKVNYREEDDKQKKKNFASNDLDTLRRNHAKNQGVKQVVIKPDNLKTTKQEKSLEHSKDSNLDNQNRLIIEPLHKQDDQENRHANEKDKTVAEDKRRKEIQDLEDKKRNEFNDLLSASVPIDPDTWRNTAYEVEQQRIDKMMSQKSQEDMMTEKSSTDPTKKSIEKQIVSKKDTVQTITIQPPLIQEKNISTDKSMADKTEQIVNDKSNELETMGQSNIDHSIKEHIQQKTFKEEKAPVMEVDMSDWRNIAYEEEQERVDKMMKLKLEEGGMVKSEKVASRKVESKPSQGDHKKGKPELVVPEKKKEKEKGSQPLAEIPWERKIDPAILKHIRENIFIKPSSEKISKEVDLIGFDIEVSKKPTPAALTEENIQISQKHETTSKAKNQSTVPVKSEPSAGKEKVKKNSFIKDWQDDLKEFFRLSKVEKKKISEVSLETVEHNLHKHSDNNDKPIQNHSNQANKEERMRIQINEGKGNNLKSTQQTESNQNSPKILDSHTIDDIKANILISEKPNEMIKTKKNSSGSEAKPIYVINSSDMSEFRNIAFEQEQERVDKAMTVKVAELIRQNSQMETTAKSQPSSGTKSPSKNISKQQEKYLGRSWPKMLDTHTIDHIRSNIFMHNKPSQIKKIKSESSGLENNPDYIINSSDMSGFKNIAYEQEQERVDKSMKVKVAELIRQNSQMETTTISQHSSGPTSPSKNINKKQEKYLDNSWPEMLDPHTISHIKDNIFMHNKPSQMEKSKNKSSGSEKVSDYVINSSDMSGFRNIAYEQEQERVDKSMEVKVAELIRQNSQMETTTKSQPSSEPTKTETETKPNVKKRSKNKDRRKTNSESRNSETFAPSEFESTKVKEIKEDLKEQENVSSEFRSRDSSILSVGGKPKVVVPSPKGIPRPRPIRKNPGEGNNRDSIISVESLEDQYQNPAESKTMKVIETAEFHHAVKSFDKLYIKQETTETQQSSFNGNSDTKQTQFSRIFDSDSPLQTDPNELEPSNGWKQIKRGRSFESSEITCDKNQNDDDIKHTPVIGSPEAIKIPVKLVKDSNTLEESNLLHTRQDLFNLDKLEKLQKHPIVIKDIRDAYDDSKLVQVLKDFQEEDSNTTKEQFSYSKVEKKTIQTSSEAQNSTVKEVNVTQTGSYDDIDVIQIQRHSLTIKNDDIVQETTTIRIDPEDLASAIDPDSLKNVDGLAKQRKGSARFARKQGTRNKSPQGSFTSPDVDEDELGTGESQVRTSDVVSSNLTVAASDLTSSAGDLTSRLEETTQRMRKVSQVLGGEELDIEDQRPLSRTENVVIKSDGSLPLDSVIQTMLKTPHESSQDDQEDDYIEMINVEKNYEKEVHHHISKGPEVESFCDGTNQRRRSNVIDNNMY